MWQAGHYHESGLEKGRGHRAGITGLILRNSMALATASQEWLRGTCGAGVAERIEGQPGAMSFHDCWCHSDTEDEWSKYSQHIQSCLSCSDFWKKVF